MWLIDSPPPAEQKHASLLGSILAILAVFPGVIPFVGLLFGVPAFLLNRRVSGWPNKASRLGLGLCITLTVVGVVASQAPLN